MKIAWIGIGHMGKPMAKHMMTVAEEFTVHDLNSRICDRHARRRRALGGYSCRSRGG